MKPLPAEPEQGTQRRMSNAGLARLLGVLALAIFLLALLLYRPA